MIKKYSINEAEIIIDFKNKCVSSLVCKGEEFIYGHIPFFSIKIRDKNANKSYLSANEFEYVKFVDSKAFYSSNQFDVILEIKSNGSNLCWRIEIKNHTNLLIEQVEIISIGLFPKLIDEEGFGEIIIPYNEGVRVTSIARREASPFKYMEVDYPSKGIYFMYPNMICSPFISYIRNGKGIYLGMHDASYTPKHIDFHVVDNCLKMEMSVFTNTDYGQDYIMDFDSVMEPFVGDYFDACEIYRKYFYASSKKKYKTIKERYDNLPRWYHNSPVVVTYPVVGKKDSDLKMEPGKLYPYTNGLKIIDDFYQKTETKMMVLLMQWESTAPWAPPYVWPPFGDTNNFYQYRDELHKRGHYLGVYTSGLGWTNKSFRRKYDKSEEFEKEHLKDIMCTNSNGFMKSTIVDNIRFGYDMCPALEKTKTIFTDEINKITSAGLDYIQVLDQNHGGNPYFCYSDKHGHIPAPGKWQVKHNKELLSRIDLKNSLLGCESAASEPYIDQLLFSDNRYILNYYLGEPIPVYSYLYHEYVNNFMGNQICSSLIEEKYALTYSMAYSFINGDLFTLVIDDEGKIHNAWCDNHIVDQKYPLTLIKNVNKWRTSKFEEYLHLGKVVKPIPYKCSKKPFKSTWDGHVFYFDSVLSMAYTNGKDIYQFFINYDICDETIELPNRVQKIVIDPNKDLIIFNDNRIKIAPLSMVAIRINKENEE